MFSDKKEINLDYLQFVIDNYDFIVQNKEDVLNKVMFIKNFHMKSLVGKTRNQQRKDKYKRSKKNGRQ